MTSDVRSLDDTPADDAMAAGEPVLSVQGLVAGYDGVAVVHGVDLHVGAGEVVALLGANGAGKTTTLLTVSGVLAAMQGRVTVLGRTRSGRRPLRPGGVAALARQGVAHVPEDRGLFYDLTVAENLRLGRPRGRGAATPLPEEQVLEWFPALRDVMGRDAGLLSGGEQQMLALARAVSARPKLLLVDEMSLGLAPIIVEHLLPVLRSVALELGAGVLLVEQHVAMVLAVSDRAYLMDRGTILASGTAAELAARPELLEAGYLGTVDDGGT